MNLMQRQKDQENPRGHQGGSLVTSVAHGDPRGDPWGGPMQQQKDEENWHGDQEYLLVVAGTRRPKW